MKNIHIYKQIKLAFLIVLMNFIILKISAQAIGDYRTAANGNWSTLVTWSRWNGSSWITPTVGQGVPSSASGVITILRTFTVTVTSNTTVDQLVVSSGGTIVINNSVTFTIANATGTDLIVSGTIINSGTISPIGTISFLSGSTYQHTEDGGTIPTATWDPNSTCIINYTAATLTTAPTGAVGQSFGNFIWNANVPNTNMDFIGLGTVTGNFLISATGNTGVTGNTLRLDASTFNISGDFTTSGNTSVNININASAQTYNIGGSLTIGGNYFFSNGTGLSTINLNGSGNTITISAPNFLDFATSSTVSNTTFHIANGASYTMNSNISISGPNNNLTIDNGGTLYTGTYIINNIRNGESASGGVFTVSSGGTLGIGSAQGISLAGNATGNIQSATRNYNSGANYIYNGTVAQSTGSGLTQNTPANITINNPGNTVSLSASTTISAQLILTSGGLSLNNNTFFVNNSATNAILRDGITYTGYVVSNSLDQNFTSILKWNIGTTPENHIFPFGVDASNYIPFTFNNTNGTSFGNVAISTYEAGTGASTALNIYANKPTIVTNLNGSGYTGNPGDAANIIKRFWKIDVTGSGTATVTFSYANAENPVSGVSANSMYAQRFNTASNSWDPPLPSQISNTSNNTVIVTGVNNFSPWTIASSSSPLPIVYLNYNATYSDGKVDVSWATASETNNDYFTIERSNDLKDVTALGTISGAGNSNVPIDYSFSDSNPGYGTIYYRIRQTDFNGKTEETNWMVVNIIPSGQISVIPGYSSGSIAVSFGNDDNAYNISIYDMTGNCINSSVRPSGSDNLFDISIPGIAPGIYIVKVSSKDYTFTKKIHLG